MKMITDDRTLREAANEFLAYKRAQKLRERTLNDYHKYINPFIEQSSNSLNIDILKAEILEYFADIPATSPARYNIPYQYLHAMFFRIHNHPLFDTPYVIISCEYFSHFL